MIKKLSILIILFIQSVILFGQDFDVSVNTVANKINIVNNRANVFFDTPITSLFIKSNLTIAGTTKFNVFVDDILFGSFKQSEVNKELKKAGVTDLRDKKITLKKDGESAVLLNFIPFQKRDFSITLSSGGPLLSLSGGISTLTTHVKIPKLFIKCITPINPANSYKVKIGSETCSPDISGNGNETEISCRLTGDLGNQTISINDETGKIPFFTFSINVPAEPPPPPPPAKLTSVVTEVKSKFPKLVATPYGLQIPDGNRNTTYTGIKYIHIFLDQFGNNIFSTIPQGVANRQYIVHVFYLENANDPNQVDYSVNQTSGEFQDVLVFNNAGQLGNNLVEPRSGEDGKKIEYKWAHKEFLLSTSTTNIQFEVTRTALKSQDAQKQEFENQTLKSYTIKMSRVLHGSFDVGLINSTLENPTFELLTSPTNSSETVVKKKEGHNRGVVTAMATFYASPIIILEDLFKVKEIPNYMLTGRNFLEDHKIYERIYPAVGVGFTDRTLNNLFFGFNWEFARGGSVFVGWHYGKVNTFNEPDGFKFEETAMTTDAFNLRKDNRWKTKCAFGLNLDIMIIRNLFRAGSSTSSTPTDN